MFSAATSPKEEKEVDEVHEITLMSAASNKANLALFPHSIAPGLSGLQTLKLRARCLAPLVPD